MHLLFIRENKEVRCQKYFSVIQIQILILGELFENNLWAHEKIPVKLHEFMRIIQDTDILNTSIFIGISS